MSSESTLPIESAAWERQQKLSSLNHLLAAAVLLMNAFHGLHEPGHVVFAIFEIAAATGLIGAFLYEQFRKGHHGGIAWFDLFGAAMLFLEAYSKFDDGRRVGRVAGRALFVQAIILLGFAFYGHRVRTYRSMTADENGFRSRLSPWRKVALSWTDIRSITLLPRKAIVKTATGDVTIGVRRMKRQADILTWMGEQFSSRGVVVTDQRGTLPGRPGDPG